LVVVRGFRGFEIPNPAIEGRALRLEPLAAGEECPGADPDRLLPIPGIATFVQPLLVRQLGRIDDLQKSVAQIEDLLQ
jgi:hypothetical protein